MPLKTKLIILLSAMSTAVFPQDQTEFPSTNEQASFQVESFASTLNNRLENEIVTTLNMLFRYGLSSKVELQLTNQYEQLSFEEREALNVNQLTLGAKFQLYQDKKSLFTASVLPSVNFPVNQLADEAFKMQYGLAALASYQLSGNAIIGVNLAYTTTFNNEEEWSYTLASNLGLTNKLSTYLEVFQTINVGELLNADIGLSYAFSEGLQLDVSYGNSITLDNEYYLLRCAWTLPEKRKTQLTAVNSKRRTVSENGS
ncbi:transporter [Spongiivirga sp. MCCC 1A20706]|uniref:transporter n=1 Tax=Spongiivirga sp. MCCC 1A20706 TaxID=3160963 RepID=UPI0039773DA1